jgi:hypothetical protein
MLLHRTKSMWWVTTIGQKRTNVTKAGNVNTIKLVSVPERRITDEFTNVQHPLNMTIVSKQKNKSQTLWITYKHSNQLCLGD